MTRRYALRDDGVHKVLSLAQDTTPHQWERIKDLLPGRREYDQYLYQARHLIENFFAKLKQYRAIATRYDKTAVNFLGTIYLVASVIWLN